MSDQNKQIDIEASHNAHSNSIGNRERDISQQIHNIRSAPYVSFEADAARPAKQKKKAPTRRASVALGTTQEVSAPFSPTNNAQISKDSENKVSKKSRLPVRFGQRHKTTQELPQVTVKGASAVKNASDDLKNVSSPRKEKKGPLAINLTKTATEVPRQVIPSPRGNNRDKQQSSYMSPLSTGKIGKQPPAQSPRGTTTTTTTVTMNPSKDRTTGSIVQPSPRSNKMMVPPSPRMGTGSGGIVGGLGLTKDKEKDRVSVIPSPRSAKNITTVIGSKLGMPVSPRAKKEALASSQAAVPTGTTTASTTVAATTTTGTTTPTTATAGRGEINGSSNVVPLHNNNTTANTTITPSPLTTANTITVATATTTSASAVSTKTSGNLQQQGNDRYSDHFFKGTDLNDEEDQDNQCEADKSTNAHQVQNSMISEDDTLMDAIRAVFVSKNTSEFAEKLEQQVTERNQNLVRLCKRHQHRVAGGVDDLFAAKESMEQIVEATATLVEKAHTAMIQIQECSSKVNSFRNVRQNIERAMVVTARAKRLAYIYTKAQNAIDDDNLHLAIKLIELFQRTKNAFFENYTLYLSQKNIANMQENVIYPQMSPDSFYSQMKSNSLQFDQMGFNSESHKSVSFHIGNAYGKSNSFYKHSNSLYSQLASALDSPVQNFVGSVIPDTTILRHQIDVRINSIFRSWLSYIQDIAPQVGLKAMKNLDERPLWLPLIAEVSLTPTLSRDKSASSSSSISEISRKNTPAASHLGRNPGAENNFNLSGEGIATSISVSSSSPSQAVLASDSASALASASTSVSLRTYEPEFTGVRIHDLLVCAQLHKDTNTLREFKDDYIKNRTLQLENHVHFSASDITCVEKSIQSVVGFFLLEIAIAHYSDASFEDNNDDSDYQKPENVKYSKEIGKYSLSQNSPLGHEERQELWATVQNNLIVQLNGLEKIKENPMMRAKLRACTERFVKCMTNYGFHSSRSLDEYA